jgi:hypothetical protein
LNAKPNQNVSHDQHEWPEALATVTACKYEFGAGRALAFGIPTTRHFRISYNYFADGELHTGEFSSAKAIPQGQLFPIRYNPDAPHQNSHDASRAFAQGPVLVIGIIGSIVLSLTWFAVLRGCH